MAELEKSKKELLTEIDFLKKRIKDLKESNIQQSRLDNSSDGSEVENPLEMHHLILQSINDAVYLVGVEDGLIKFANAVVERIFGFSSKELLGKNIYDLFDPGDKSSREFANEVLAKVSEYGKCELEVNGIKKDGSRFWSHVNISKFNHFQLGEVLILVHQDISNQKRAEEEIQYQNELIDQVDSAIISYDLDNKILSWNKFAEVLYQFKSKEVLGKDAVEILVPEPLKDNYYSSLNILQSTGKSEMDGDIIRKDGTSFHGHIITSFLRDLKGEIVGYIQVSYDLTTRKRTEDALKISERKYRGLTNLLPQIVFEIDAKGNITYVNKQANRVLGYSVSDFRKGINVIDLLCHEERAIARKNLKSALAGGDIGDPEYKILKKDGESIPILIYVNRIEENRRTVGLRGIMVDVSKQKLAEESLRESEERYRSYIDNATVAVLISDSQGNYLDVNPAACRMTGYSREELLNSTILDITSPQQLEAEKHTIENLKSRGRVQSESSVRRKDGTDFPVNLSLVAIPGDRFMSFCTDITEQKRVEEELRESEEKYKNLYKNALVGMFSISAEDGKVIIANDAAAKIFGYSSINKFKDYFRSIDHYANPGDREHVIQRLKKNGFISKIVMHSKKLDGTLIWNEASFRMSEDKKIIDCIFVDISERILAEKALKESKNLFTLFMRNSPIFCYIKEVNANASRVLMASENFNLMTGIPGSQMVGKTMDQLFPSKFASKITEEDLAVVTSGEKSIIYEDLNDRNYITFKFPISLGGKNLLAGYTIDITESKQAEKALYEIKERFDLAVNATKDGIYDWNLLTNEIYFSPATKKMLGYEDHEITNDPRVWEKMTNPEDVKRSLKMQKQLVNRELDRLELEVRMKHKDGHWVDILSRQKAIFDKNGKAIRIIGTNVDITELREAEKDAIKERDRRQQYLDIANIMLLSLDVDGIVKLINPKGCEILGYPENEIVGHIWYDKFLPERLREQVKEVAKKVSSDEMESVRYYENFIINKSGEERLIAWNNAVFKNSDGQISGTLSSGEDITERRLAEEELKSHHDHLEDLVSERTKELELKNKELDQMLKVFVGRELKIKELTGKIRVLERKIE